jgi:hypothetical protein
MRDCTNAEMRDRLPDLLHERMSAADRARVLAHAGACPECAAELDLLRSLGSVLAGPRHAVDVGAIGRAARIRIGGAPAEPAAPTRAEATPWREPVRRPAWAVRSATRLRAAAAVVVFAAAGAVLVARGPSGPASGGGGAVAVSPVGPTARPSAADTPAPLAAAGTRRAPPADVASQPADGALGNSFADLSDAELAAIVDAVSESDAYLPSGEPDGGPGVLEVDEV